jgi:hypothetical protein
MRLSILSIQAVPGTSMLTRLQLALMNTRARLICTTLTGGEIVTVMSPFFPTAEVILPGVLLWPRLLGTH